MKFHGSSPLAELGMAVIYMCGMQNLSPRGVGVRLHVDNGIFNFQWCDWKWITIESQFLEFSASLTFR